VAATSGPRRSYPSDPRQPSRGAIENGELKHPLAGRGVRRGPSSSRRAPQWRELTSPARRSTSGAASPSASLRGPFYKDKKVVVIGGRQLGDRRRRSTSRESGLRDVIEFMAVKATGLVDNLKSCRIPRYLTIGRRRSSVTGTASWGSRSSTRTTREVILSTGSSSNRPRPELGPRRGLVESIARRDVVDDKCARRRRGSTRRAMSDYPVQADHLHGRGARRLASSRTGSQLEQADDSGDRRRPPSFPRRSRLPVARKG